MSTTQVRFRLNDEERAFAVSRGELLLDVLRREGYTGSKRGCDTGACGACTVIVDGDPEMSCVLPAKRVEGSEVETIEGLGSQDDLHPIQQAFVDHNAAQCGFCIPGMIMSAKGLLDDDPDPDEATVREAIDENLCRCTGYEKPVAAILAAADEMGADPVAGSEAE